MNCRWIAAFIAAIIMVVALGSSDTAFAATDTGMQYCRGKVVSVAPLAAGSQPSVQVELLNCSDKGRVVPAMSTGMNSAADLALPTYRAGDVVVLGIDRQDGGAAAQYALLDHYRLPQAAGWLVMVVVLGIVFAGLRGLGSVAGLGMSLVVIGGFVIPQVLHGGNPYVITLVASFVIATLGIYCAHGLSRRTTLALAGIYLTLIMVVGLSALAVHLSNLNGVASEDISYLHQQLPALDLQGLLFGGIMLGVVGVLDDIAVGQAAAVGELHKANGQLTWRELYSRGLMIGREHIASLITTLVLAYAGSAMVFVVYVAAVQNLPWWLVLNSELVMEEVIRSLVGSAALILAVPITTGLAAYFLASQPAAPRHNH